MNDLFLGLIALGVLIMATIQVVAIVVAVRATRRVHEAVATLNADIKPIVENLRQMSADAAKAAATASAQVDRAEKLIDEFTSRIEHTVASLQDKVLAPAREGFALLQNLRALFSFIRGDQRRAEPRAAEPRREPREPAGKRPAAAEDEDPLFIG
jgi:hypothetical protein